MDFKLFSLLASLSLILAIPALAEEPKAPKKGAAKKELTREEIAKLGGFEPAPEDPVMPATVQMELMVVQVPKADAPTISADLKNRATADAAYRDLIAGIKKKQFTLIGCPQIETKPGNRCVIETITEFRYATEFDRLEGGKANPPAKVDPVAPLLMQAPAAVGVVPTSFETRNTGITFEAEPILGPVGKTVDLQFAAHNVQLIGWEPNNVEEKGQLVQRMPQPRFHTNKVSSSLTLPVGERVLIGVFNSPRDTEAVELFLLRVGTRPLKAK
jgi:hypothetical protein